MGVLLAAAAVAAAAAAAVPTQIHISYTQVPGEFAVDFVAQDPSGYVSFAVSAGGPFTTRPSTSFNFTTIGFMHQALMSFNDSATGFYKVGAAGSESALFAVTPTPAPQSGGLHATAANISSADAQQPPWRVRGAPRA